ncbi:L-idonate 5-dehydrogenase (NAD(P)(+)) [Ensifer sp. M14]|uniref:L-idonate 5-dehydrogenase n=1 Tax=Ensifer sp. M14 TaxID=2203782 RepID=UPI000E1D2414|nr:L-idonate 5-dehydrogenase [Ensifer sp. M14]RDL47271.1 L-idonate 5-dehydrogenase (NAD(P)(+)) [Ensifer sp. M14]
MRAVVAYGSHDLRLETRPEDIEPGDGEVMVRIAAGGICGSDLHYYHNGGFGSVSLKEPMILGHEASGVVAVVGKGVEGLVTGQLVAINPSLPCGKCEECRRGLRNHCNDMVFRGSAMRFPHAQGLFRDTLIVRSDLLYPVGSNVDAGLAALAEPFAVCLHAIKQAGSLLGKIVLVSGCGPIGCLTIAAARLAGAKHVIACDVVEAPLAIAPRLGADEVVLNGPDATGLSAYKAGKGKIDVAFDCTGHPAAVASAIDCLRPRGTLVAVGLGGSMPFPLPFVVTKELNVTGSFRFDAEFAEAVDLISSSRIDLSPLISHTYCVDHVVDAFDLAADRSRAMKVQIDFR